MTKVNKDNLINEKVDLTEIKGELNDYIDLRVKKCIDDELDKTNRKIIKSKNFSLFIKNIIIIILLIVIIYLVYLLYNVGYFNNNKTFKNDYLNRNNEVKDENNASGEDKKEPTLEELKNEYSYLLDNVIINENSIYLEKYYNGELTPELKNYLAFETLDFNNLVVEDDYNVIEEQKLKDNYVKLFGQDYKSISFDYDGDKVRYINKLSSYITNDILEKHLSNIKREISAIDVLDNEVIITAIEGLYKEDKLYNILTGDEVEEYDGNSLVDYETSLNKVIYKFKNEILISIN